MAYSGTALLYCFTVTDVRVFLTDILLCCVVKPATRSKKKAESWLSNRNVPRIATQNTCRNVAVMELCKPHGKRKYVLDDPGREQSV
jgi:hypothetical protein